MSLNLSNDTANRLIAALHENSQEAAKLRAAYRASLPQYIDLKGLCSRLALDAKEIRALLEIRKIRWQPHGRSLRVHIDEVLRLESILRKDAA